MSSAPPRTRADVAAADSARLETQLAEGTLLLRASGAWRIGAPYPSPQEVERALASPGLRRLAFDTSGVSSWDSALLSFLVRVLEAGRSRGLELDLDGLPAGLRRLLALAEAVPEKEGARKREARPPLLERLGNAALAAYSSSRGALSFLGELALAFGRFLTFRARWRRSDLALFLQECSAEALPIVTLISFLVGLILAFVGAVQLRQFGAAVYVADLVGIAMTREMGALMVAIIMAGRTGAAYAAQLGTMRVTQEIDALTTLGLAPMEFLVLPRALALCMMLPLLTLYADAVGILGGAAVGIGMLDLTGTQFYEELRLGIRLQDIGLGVVKGAIFGVLIAYAGCRQGMECGKSAAAVGDAATRAVVSAIVLIVVADGLFAVICEVLGI